MGTTLFNIFTIFLNDWDDGIEITPTRYDDARLCVEVDISEERAILQRDLVRLRVIQQASKNRTAWSLSKARPKSCTWVWITKELSTNYRIHVAGEPQPPFWGSWWTTSWTAVSWVVVKKASQILGCIYRGIISREAAMVILILALVRPYLECCAQFWPIQERCGQTADSSKAEPWRWPKCRRYWSVRKDWRIFCTENNPPLQATTSWDVVESSFKMPLDRVFCKPI